MASYNGERFLTQQLQSLRDQCVLPIELVVCDDQSTDETVNVLRKFSSNAPFEVKIFINEARLGYRANFMRAASCCRGEYICFCDQDDVWRPEKLQTLARAASNGRSMLLEHAFQLIDDNGGLIAAPTNRSAAGINDVWATGLGFTQMFHRSLLHYSKLWDLSVDHQFVDERMGHDQWIRFLAGVLGETLFIPDILAYYRRHSTNTMLSLRRGESPSAKDHPLLLWQKLRGSEAKYLQRRWLIIEKLERKFKAAQARVQIIDKISVAGAPGPRLKSQRQYYSEFIGYSKNRLDLYHSKNRMRKVRQFTLLMMTNQYTCGERRRLMDGLLDLAYGLLY